MTETVTTRFCSLCGQREDDPQRDEWCDDDSGSRHSWGNPQTWEVRR